MDILLISSLVLVTLGGILLAALQLPGIWLILAAAAGYDWYYDWQSIGWPWLVGLVVFAGMAELLDMLASVTAARKAGASRRAAIGSLIGGFAGMIVLSLPVPVLGTIAGGLLGCFLGAFIGELTLHDNVRSGAKVGLFATLGRIVGLVAKTAAAMMIAGAILSLALLSMFA